nr:ATP-binding protein [Endozoicomonas sp.]
MIGIGLPGYGVYALRRAQDERGSNPSVILAPGIPEKLRQKVFDRFYRADSDRHASGVEGAGLGLSIVAHIVELHNAGIGLGVAKPGGLEVIVTLDNYPAVNQSA